MAVTQVIVGFESDHAPGVAAQINRWLKDHPDHTLVSMVMAGTTTGYDSDHVSELWGALVTTYGPELPS
jgi:hypothetical protein